MARAAYIAPNFSNCTKRKSLKNHLTAAATAYRHNVPDADENDVAKNSKKV